MSNIVGIILILIALGATRMFEGLGLHYLVLIPAMLFFVPMCIWIKIVFFPTKERKNELKIMHLNRRHRNYITKKRIAIYNGVADIEEIKREIEDGIEFKLFGKNDRIFMKGPVAKPLPPPPMRIPDKIALERFKDFKPTYENREHQKLNKAKKRSQSKSGDDELLM